KIQKKVPIDGVITVFAAVDPDTGLPAEDVTYAKGTDPENWFTIDEETAEAKLRKEPDRESPFVVNGTYIATVLVITNDMPSKTATGTIAIQVLDSNDHCPTLTTTHSTQCTDETTVYVTAFDEDANPNGAAFTFRVIPDGTRGSWDVEVVNDMPSKTTTGTIAIQVLDSNDHCPTLTTTHSTQCTDETTVYVTAFDEDANPNGAAFTFRVIPDGTRGSWDVEVVNETSATLHSRDPLWPGLYEVQVEVLDAQGLSSPTNDIFTVDKAMCALPAKDCSLEYHFEGQGSAGLVSCPSLLETDNDLQFLDDLGPKFKTLSDIFFIQPVYYNTSPVPQPMHYVVQPQLQNMVMMVEGAHGANFPGFYVVRGTQSPSSGLVFSGPQGSPPGLVIQGIEGPKSPASPVSPTFFLPSSPGVSTGSGPVKGWKMKGPNPDGKYKLVKNKSRPDDAGEVDPGSSQGNLSRGAILVKEAAPPQGVLDLAAQGSVYGILPGHTVAKRGVLLQ
ncbi:hypothetical protein NQZ68_022500, partial [Dissostichus eleginoides]